MYTYMGVHVLDAQEVDNASGGFGPRNQKQRHEYLSKIDGRKDLTTGCQACMMVLSKGKEDREWLGNGWRRLGLGYAVRAWASTPPSSVFAVRALRSST